jgi:Bifunctional DNA primase/polymerase, N-terminal
VRPRLSIIWLDPDLAEIEEPEPAGMAKRTPHNRDLPSLFSDGLNVGLLLGEPSDGLVDVDLDSPEARTLASQMLPKTEMISGRASSPSSPYWYLYSSLSKTVKFLDPLVSEDERAMIVEFRNTGSQTVVSRSVHPSGEAYEWYSLLQPAHVSGDDLLMAVRKLAAALVTRQWKRSQRHTMALAISGMLLRAGWERPRIENFIKVIATAANNEAIIDRGREVETTELRLQSGENATGMPSLGEMLGEKAVASLQKRLAHPVNSSGLSYIDSTGDGEAVDDALEQLRGLSEDSSPAEVESALRQFAIRIKTQDAAAREIARENAIGILTVCGCSSPARLVNAAMRTVAEPDKEKESKQLDLRGPEAWPDPVNGAVLLDDFAKAIGHFVSVAAGFLKGIALWILYSHVFDAYDISPLLAITSPEKRCGKTTLLTLLHTFVSPPQRPLQKRCPYHKDNRR